ncbi:interleukin-1 receptor type 2-like isoform X2 [Cheilinus undulatus]|nr:interleukin-1 receptor type 2-like isoform X2 [Cheilinus undulatus]XP_041662474.1 interleukin-1 receptor type 2-like isoform X2 [Cheilinus undulatus]XP_041662476.1 interleukin-1 receptor type 2-like isoform X2 [Cheilinus undulatus]
MGLSLIPRRLLFFLGTFGICSGFVQENCINYELQFERVYSIPGDVAMLNSTLVSPDVFNFTTVPYNITWYDSKTGHEINNQTGRILVQEMTLWFLQTTLDDNGEYVTILRTPSRCFMQTTKLIVDLPVDGECGSPRKVYQALTKGFTDKVSCPLEDQIKKLESYNITPSLKWYKGCEPIEDETDRYTYWDKTKLRIDQVHSEDNGLYTCTLTFTLGGVRGSMSETINAWVKAEYTLTPQVHEPANEIIKTEIGSNFTKRCLVFVPCVGIPIVDIMWLVEDDFIFSTDPTDRIYISETRVWSQDEPVKGFWFEKLLMFSELKEKDFNVSYTCRVYSNRAHHEGYFILQPADPDILLPIGLTLCGVTVIFVSSVIIFYIFKADIVLWFRRAFPVFHPNKDDTMESCQKVVADVEDHLHEGAQYPPEDPVLSRIVHYISKKKMPADLPPSVVSSKSDFPRHLIPHETICTECSGQTVLSEPQFITATARIMTVTDVTESMYFFHSNYLCCRLAAKDLLLLLFAMIQTPLHLCIFVVSCCLHVPL